MFPEFWLFAATPRVERAGHIGAKSGFACDTQCVNQALLECGNKEAALTEYKGDVLARMEAAAGEAEYSVTRLMLWRRFLAHRKKVGDLEPDLRFPRGIKFGWIGSVREPIAV
jgi:hypothetical protein